MASKTALLIGGTGKQGRCVMKHFFANKQWKLKLLTRKPEGALAMEFASKGAEIYKGDLHQKETVEAAMKGCNAVFMCLEPWEIGGVVAETRIGKEVIDLALKHKIEHFIYSSVASSQDNTGIPHFESKWKIEQYLSNSGLAYTILKPVSLMENLLAYKDEIAKGMLPLPVKSTTRLQMVACDDIGWCVITALNNKKEWEGKCFELAGDEMTAGEYAKELKCKFEEVHLDKVPTPEMKAMYHWFNEKGFKVDIAGLRKMYPNLHTFKKWASTVNLKAPEGTQ